jgi:4-hydroxy-tetrahydrodipicolinate synthase
MNLLGGDVGGLRMPMPPMEPQNVERLAQAMKDYGLKLA